MARTKHKRFHCTNCGYEGTKVNRQDNYPMCPDCGDMAHVSFG